MKAVIIAGAAVAAILLGLFVAGLCRLLWLSVPYETWLECLNRRSTRFTHEKNRCRNRTLHFCNGFARPRGFPLK